MRADQKVTSSTSTALRQYAAGMAPSFQVVKTILSEESVLLILFTAQSLQLQSCIERAQSWGTRHRQIKSQLGEGFWYTKLGAQS